MHTLTWRQIQNKKITKDFYALTDYEQELLRHERNQKIRHIILGVLIFIFFMLAMGIAGRQDLIVMSK